MATVIFKTGWHVISFRTSDGGVYRICGVEPHGDHGVKAEARRTMKWLARKPEAARAHPTRRLPSIYE